MCSVREETGSSDLPSSLLPEASGGVGVPLGPALCSRKLLEELGSPWSQLSAPGGAGVPLVSALCSWRSWGPPGPWLGFCTVQGSGGRSRAAGGLITWPQHPLLLKLNPLAALTRAKHLVCHGKTIPQRSALPPAVKLISGLKIPEESLLAAVVAILKLQKSM